MTTVGRRGLNEVRWASNRQVLYDAEGPGDPGVLKRIDVMTRTVWRIGPVDEVPAGGLYFNLSANRSLLALTTRCLGACKPHTYVEVGIAGASGGAVRQLPHSPGDDEQDASFSPDGKEVVFARGATTISHRAGEAYDELFVESTAGGPARDLGYDGWGPTFSPDGRWIAFITAGEVAPGVSKLIVAIIPADAGKSRFIGLRRPAPIGLARADMFTWAPHSDTIAYATNQDTGYLGTVDVTGHRHQFDLGGIRYINHTPQWSPDGTQIAFTGVPLTGKGLRNGIYVIGTDGRGMRRLA
ncbi:MAG: hypothetical protein ABI317_13110 [Gaiellales bacterium]